jgi:hypothetical protein
MDRLAELAGYAQSFPGMVDEDFIAAGFSPDEVYSYRINQQAQSETARARELASMQEQRRARGQALAAQYPDYFRQGLETEPLYGIDQRMSDIKAGAELTQDPNFARRQFARLATDLGLPLSLTESALGLAELTPYGSFASGFDVAASIPQTAEYLREGEYGRAALSGAGGVLAALDVIGASLPITVPAARAVSKIDTGKLAADVVGTGRALVDMDLEFLRGRGNPALAQGVGADVPGRPPLTFDEVEAAMKAEAPATVPARAKSPEPPQSSLIMPGDPRFNEPIDQMPAVVDTKLLMPQQDKDVILANAPKGKAKDIEQQVIAQKSNYPPNDGWAQDVMKVNKISSKKDLIEVEYKEVPYGFEKPPFGVDSDQWQATMASKAVDEIKILADRVLAGDPAAEAILKQANWYRGMRTSLRKEFGGMGDVFADLLGATSAQTGVEMNWNNAVEVMRRFSRGEYDTELKMYEDMLEKGNINPTTLQQMHKDPKSPFRLITNAAGSLFNANSPAATKALFDMFRVAGGSPKTPNFTGNLIGYTNAATVDVWAARFLRRISGKDRLPPPVEKGVSGKHLVGSTLEEPNVGGEFGFGQKVLADASAQINQQGIIKSIAPQFADMNPDDLQAVAWFIEKEKWTKNGWTTKAGEGGSFEFESSLAGAADPVLTKTLRRRITESFKPPPMRKTETADAYAARIKPLREAHMSGAAEAQKELDQTKAPLARYVLGISVERPGVRPTNVQQAEIAGRLGEPAKADPSVVTYQINNTYGRFMQSDERAFNAEFVVRQNFDPSGVTRRMVEVAKEADQDAAFISKVVAERTTDSRPGVEIYFRNRQGPDFARTLSDKLTEYGVDGFTFVTDSRVMDQAGRQAALTDEAVAGINGLRFQYIPEFDVGKDAWRNMTPDQRAAKIDEVEELFDDITRDIVKTEKGISAANVMHYETNVIERGGYDEYLR